MMSCGVHRAGRGYVWRDETGTPVERGEVLSGGPGTVQIA